MGISTTHKPQAHYPHVKVAWHQPLPPARLINFTACIALVIVEFSDNLFENGLR